MNRKSDPQTLPPMQVLPVTPGVPALVPLQALPVAPLSPREEALTEALRGSNAQQEALKEKLKDADAVRDAMLEYGSHSSAKNMLVRRNKRTQSGNAIKPRGMREFVRRGSQQQRDPLVGESVP